MKLHSLMIVVLLMTLLSACIAPVQPAPAAEPAGDQAMHEHGGDEHTAEMSAQLGEVNFPVSCSAEAQAEFNHAMALLHSFEYGAAIKSFNATAELDSSCAMAQWGIAMSLAEPIWGGPSDVGLEQGHAALEKARSVGIATPREQAYIDAISIIYTDYDTVDRPTRMVAYEQAMAQLAQDFPDDTEAKIFHALALIATAQPTDKTFANQHKAVEILEPIFAEQPNHPGVAHYLIHANDYPALAGEGVDAALRFADIAPAAPHALHMPSHIFTRIGYWQESIDTNLASVNVFTADLPGGVEPGMGYDTILHSQDYMVYAYLQLAQDEAAKAVVDEVSQIENVDVEAFSVGYALATIPSRYALERGQWAEAAALALHPATFTWDNFPAAEAVLVFARGLGAARSGDADAARQDLERLQVLHEALVANEDTYWAGEVDLQRREVEAWILLAEGKHDDALAMIREAADIEDTTEKHPVSPGRLVPARELLAEMLLSLDEPAEALSQFEAALKHDPNRFRSVFGAAHAAEAAGEMEQAQTYYEQLMTLAEHADSVRAEVAEAEAFLSQ